MQTRKNPLLPPGGNIRAIHRRCFEKDVRRPFVGRVEACEAGVARAAGYVFVIDGLSQRLFTRRPDRRPKLVRFASGDVLVNVLPETVDPAPVRYELDGRKLGVTDGSAWGMDVRAFGWC
jgi:hypothetical protein